MEKGNRLLKGALMLTCVNLLLRFGATGFQVWLSGRIGAGGIGLLQLILTVNGLALTIGGAGGRTTAMYLAAEELGRGNIGNADRMLSGCFIYSILCSGSVSLSLFLFAPELARSWIGTGEAVPALRTWAAFLPVVCLSGVMTGYFTAANRIGTLALVEVAEQGFIILFTGAVLFLGDAHDRVYACRSVVLGTCMGAILTLICLIVLYGADTGEEGERLPRARRILRCAIPLALADDLKAGITSVENLMVPRRLSLYPGVGDPLAAFGRISGMVFPVMMFPAAILSALAEVLIPELARCAAVGSRNRIRYLVRRNLRSAAVYGMVCGGILFLLAEPICRWLYPGEEVSGQLQSFAVLVPMLYTDLIADAMTKGLGEQAACVRYSIISNVFDVALLYVLLPRFGMEGYFVSFTVTHLLNFLLSMRRVLKIGGVRIGWRFPLFGGASLILAVLGGMCFAGPIRRTAAFLGLLFGLCFLSGVLTKADVRWLVGMLKLDEKYSEKVDATNS